MPISHITHAVAGNPDQPGQESQRQYVLFDATSASNFSATFDVNQQPWYIQAFNLAENDIVYVQMASGTGSGVYFSTMFQFGTAVQLNSLKNKLRIDMPGRYRLMFSGASVQAVKVTGFPATMTQESISGFAEALTEVVNSFYTAATAVEGGTNITVNGSGGVLDPYVIDFVAANAVNVNSGTNIAITGDGSSGNPYVVSFDAAFAVHVTVNGLPLLMLGNGSAGSPYNLSYTHRYNNYVNPRTADYTVDPLDSGTVFTNTGASGDIVLSLPAATVGLNFLIILTVAHYIKCLANGTNTIQKGVTVSAPGGYIRSNDSAGAAIIQLYCVENGKWVCPGYSSGTIDS